MLKNFSLFLLVLNFLFIPQLSLAIEKQEMYFFWSKGCPHCTKEKLFLEKIEPKYSNIIINKLELGNSMENVELLLEFGKKFHADISGVPFTVVGDKYFIGYYSDETTGAEIEQAIKDKLSTILPPPKPLPVKDKEVPLIIEDQEDENSIIDNEEVLPPIINNQNEESAGVYEKIKLPIIGEINLKNLSLPIITIVLGLLDGFNPCAMWALLFLISLLLGMKDRKRMWILGTSFVFASAFVYFLFMVAWLKLILFLGFITIVKYLIGLVALAGGSWNIRSYLKNKEGTCQVSGGVKRRRFFDMLKEVTQKRVFILALLGIIVLAFAVNLVELICSAGLPAVYVQILALNTLSVWQYYAYITLYIFIFMLDDLFVFFVAMWTLQMTGITTKYVKYSKLVGGTLMVIIGLILIFKHELLMLG